MLTRIQLSHLSAYTCPSCKAPLGIYHAYPVTPPTLLSQLTDSVPMHPTCALKAAPLLIAHAAERAEWLADDLHAAIIWQVNTSSKDVPSGRLFQRAPGDAMIHLHTPSKLRVFISRGPTPPEKLEHMRRASIEEVREVLKPTTMAAARAATTEEETDEIAHQIARLLRYLGASKKSR